MQACDLMRGGNFTRQDSKLSGAIHKTLMSEPRITNFHIKSKKDYETVGRDDVGTIETHNPWIVVSGDSA